MNRPLFCLSKLLPPLPALGHTDDIGVDGERLNISINILKQHRGWTKDGRFSSGCDVGSGWERNGTPAHPSKVFGKGSKSSFEG